MAMESLVDVCMRAIAADPPGQVAAAGKAVGMALIVLANAWNYQAAWLGLRPLDS